MTLISARSSILLGFAGILLPPSLVLAQALDIDEAVRYALENQPALLASEQKVVAAREQATAADATDLPVVSVSHTARISDNPLDAFADKLFTRSVVSTDFAPALLNNPDNTELYLTRLSVSWSLYNGGRNDAMQMRSDKMLEASELQHQHSRQEIAFNTTKAYLYALAANEAVTISKNAVKTAESHANTTASLYKDGRIVESDKLAAQVSLAAVRSQYEQALTRQKKALNQLAQIMGLKGTSVLSIGTTWPALPTIEADLASLQQNALTKRSDLEAARIAVDAAEAAVDVVAAEEKPSVDLIANSDWYDDQPGFDAQSTSLMAVASFKLYDGKTSSKVGSARAQAKELGWNTQALEQTVQKQVKDAWDNLQEAEKRNATASDNVTLAQRAAKLVKERYGQGRTILLDLLQAEKMKIDAQVEDLTAKLARHVSCHELALASGTYQLPETER